MAEKPTTVEQYLSALAPERAEALGAVRRVILENLDRAGYEEGIQYGMIGYFVPHRVYPAGYHVDPREPLPFVSLASQKNHMALYLLPLYVGAKSDEPTPLLRWFQSAWAKTGKKLELGKSCLRFKRLSDLSLEIIGQLIQRMPAERYVAAYESGRLGVRAKKPAASKRTARPEKPTAKKHAVKRAATKRG